MTNGYSIVTERNEQQVTYPGATIDQFYPGVLTVTDVASGDVTRTYGRGTWLSAARFDADDYCAFAFRANSRRHGVVRFP